QVERAPGADDPDRGDAGGAGGGKRKLSAKAAKNSKEGRRRLTTEAQRGHRGKRWERGLKRAGAGWGLRRVRALGHRSPCRPPFFSACPVRSADSACSSALTLPLPSSSSRPSR